MIARLITTADLRSATMVRTLNGVDIIDTDSEVYLRLPLQTVEVFTDDLTYRAIKTTPVKSPLPNYIFHEFCKRYAEILPSDPLSHRRMVAVLYPNRKSHKVVW